MSLNRYLDDNESNSENILSANKSNNNCDCDSCDSESARALKRILALLDDLNNKDLRLLDDIVERLVCSRKKS